MTQKFFKGDLVQIGNMPAHRHHFDGNCKAIVIATYTEQHGKTENSDKKYTLFILTKSGGNDVSWYYEDELTLILPDRFDLLPASNIHRKVWEAKNARVICNE